MASISKSISKKSKDNSKQQLAYNKIKAAIIKNELLPDTLLVERQLCLTLGISRTPIREALRRLSTEGLVDFIPDKGMFVSKIRFEDVIEIHELREALEGMAIKLFILRKNDGIVRQMRECLSQQEQAYKDGLYDLNVEKDMEFHDLFIKGSKNSRLINFSKTLRDQNSRVAFYTVTDRERIETSLEQHKKVLDAVEQNNADLAEKLIREHIVNIKEYHISKHYLVK